MACAQYHHRSNDLGGVRVEYMYESDRKAWVRDVPPRWIWDGTAICAVPSEVSRAMLRGWHANNGVVLGNPRLGFVCTKQTVDGQPGLEGYYCEHDRDLAPEERLRFAPGEDGPDFDPAAAPRVAAATWPAERLQKAARNYAMAYVRTILQELVSAFGPADAAYLGGTAGRLIGMQYYARTAELLGVAPGGRERFADYLVNMGRAQGDDTAAAPAGDQPGSVRRPRPRRYAPRPGLRCDVTCSSSRRKAPGSRAPRPRRCRRSPAGRRASATRTGRRTTSARRRSSSAIVSSPGTWRG